MSMSQVLKKIFAEVPHTYELINHVITFGMDIIWRRKAAGVAVSGAPVRCLDMCSGTGEMAAYLRKRTHKGSVVVAADFSMPMLKGATQKPGADGIGFILADAKCLPFRSGTFDVITTSYATRNMNITRDSLVKCFSEFNRVLKPGGAYVSVETSQPPSAFIRRLYHFYVRLAVRRVGFLISHSRTAYAWLATSMTRFYHAEELAAIMQESGFARASYQRLTLGAAAIHRAVKG